INGTTTTGNSGGYADLALRATTGNVTVNNSAVLLGRIQAGGVTAANSVKVNNVSVGAAQANWHSTGTSTLGAGADTVTNDGSAGNAGLIGLASNGVTTTIDFGAGADTLNNGNAVTPGNGVIVVGENNGTGVTSASTVNFTGLENFNNNGRI